MANQGAKKRKEENARHMSRLRLVIIACNSYDSGSMAKETCSQDRLKEIKQEMGQTRNKVNELRNSMSRIEMMLREIASKIVQANATSNGDVGGPVVSALGRRGVSGCPQFAKFNGYHPGNYAFPTKFSRIEFLKFDGGDFKGWAFRCKHFFEVDETPMDQRIRIISMHLEGKALQWHQTFMKRKKIEEISWAEYIEALGSRFGEVLNVDPMSSLKKLEARRDSGRLSREV